MLLVATLLLLPAPLVQTESISASQVRTLTLTVTDRNSTALSDLSVEDLQVIEDGMVRTPIQLERDARPVTLALLVDSSEPIATFFRLFLVDAVRGFLGRLPTGSRYALWTTGERPTKVVDLTGEVTETTKALWRSAPRGGNMLLDTLVEASRDLKRIEGARRAVVAITGSGLGFSNYDRRNVIDLALGGGVVFWSVRFDEGAAGNQGDVGPVDYDYVLSGLAKRTGGQAHFTLSAMGVARALDKIAAGIGSQYRLTYRAALSARTPQIEIKVARPGAKARVGPGLP